MKLITWNIQWVLGTDGRCDLARVVADARRLADFDVLCLQEVSDNFPELRGTRGANQFAELARLMPGYAAIEGVALDIPDQHGRRKRFGNMVLSRYPVGQVLRWTLPWEADHTRNMPRSLIEAVVMAPFGPVRVMTTHRIFVGRAAARRGRGHPRCASQRLCPRRESPRGGPRHLRHPTDRALRHPHRRLQHEAGGPDEASHMRPSRPAHPPSSTPGRRSIGMRRIRPRSACSTRPTGARIVATSSS